MWSLVGGVEVAQQSRGAFPSKIPEWRGVPVAGLDAGQPQAAAAPRGWVCTPGALYPCPIPGDWKPVQKQQLCFYHLSFEMSVNKGKTHFKSTSNPFFVPLHWKFPIAIKTSIKNGSFSENPGGFIASDCSADENILVLNHCWLFSARKGRWSAPTSDKLMMHLYWIAESQSCSALASFASIRSFCVRRATRGVVILL